MHCGYLQHEPQTTTRLNFEFEFSVVAPEFSFPSSGLFSRKLLSKRNPSGESQFRLAATATLRDRLRQYKVSLCPVVIHSSLVTLFFN
jgi:hypothetical protein